MTPSFAATAATCCAAFVVATATAATAHAGETGYLARLADEFDFVLTGDGPAAAVETGRIVCEQLGVGVAAGDVASSVNSALPDLTPEQAKGLVYAAQRELCPDIFRVRV